MKRKNDLILQGIIKSYILNRRNAADTVKKYREIIADDPLTDKFPDAMLQTFAFYTLIEEISDMKHVVEKMRQDIHHLKTKDEI